MAGSDEGSEERTEEATQQRREDFRKEGQVAQSRDVAAIMVMFGVAIVFYFTSRAFLAQAYELFTQSFTDHMITAARQGDFLPALRMAGLKTLFLAGPVLLVIAIMAVAASVMQIGFMSTWESLSPDINRINPIAGMQKLMKLRSIVEGLKATFKIVIIGFVTYLYVKDEITNASQLMQFDVAQMLSYIALTTFKMILGVLTLLAVIALLDYGYQWWDLEKRMKMTKQEIKEEYKQREGDPIIKSRIRRLQREMASKRMMDKVKKADVIITNPTHIAVALMYDRNKMAAPVVVAKGADLIAERIKEIARKLNIPVVENKPLARTIYKTIKLNHPIPRTLFTAVAEVLAYVYKLKGRVSG